MSWNISKLRHTDWDNLISNFNQKSFHNIFSYGEVKINQSWNIYRIIYYDQNNQVSAAQIFFKNKFKFTIINIPGGIEGVINSKILKDLQTFLSNQFGKFSFSIMSIAIEEKYLKNCYPWKKMISSYEYNLTMKKNLIFDKEQIKKSFSKNWRHNLKRSNNYDIITTINNNPKINELLHCYNDLEKIKSIKVHYNYDELSLFFKYLKNNIVHIEARQNNQLLAFRTIVFNKPYAWDFLAAGNMKARQTYSTYKLMYDIFCKCIDNSISHFDFSGVDPKKNIGVYNFKKGTGAKDFRKFGEVTYSPILLLQYIMTVLIFIKRIFKH
jgi:lipid II:glycine glycyltransferase (peptidoglycan interpeptide bridge formation enzyme)